MQPEVRKCGCSARIGRGRNDRRIGCNPPNAAALQGCFDLRCEPTCMAGLADDWAIQPLPHALEEWDHSIVREGQTRRQLHKDWPELLAQSSNLVDEAVKRGIDVDESRLVR